MPFNGEMEDKNSQNRIRNMELFEHCRHACIMPTAETLNSIMFTVSKAETEHAEKIEHIAAYLITRLLLLSAGSISKKGQSQILCKPHLRCK